MIALNAPWTFLLNLFQSEPRSEDSLEPSEEQTSYEGDGVDYEDGDSSKTP